MTNVVLFKPVFVVGHPRSGTTLLATVLGRHSNLSMPPETQFFVEQRHLEGRVLNANDLDVILKSPRIADLSLSRDDVQFAFSNTDRTCQAAFATIIDCFRAQQGKLRAGEKSPFHLYMTEELLDWFPDAKLICMERNGVEVIASLMRMPWSHRNVVKHAFSWRQTIRLAHSFEKRFPDRFMRISFEKFTSNPEGETRRICEFCELDFETKLLRIGSADAVPEWESGWKARALQSIKPPDPRGQQQLTSHQQAQVGTLANRELEQRGYETIPVGLGKRFGVWLGAWPYHPLVHPFLRKLNALIRR